MCEKLIEICLLLLLSPTHLPDSQTTILVVAVCDLRMAVGDIIILIP